MTYHNVVTFCSLIVVTVGKITIDFASLYSPTYISFENQYNTLKHFKFLMHIGFTWLQKLSFNKYAIFKNVFQVHICVTMRICQIQFLMQ